MVLRQRQREAALSHLYSLAMACRRRFLRAADLLELRGPVFEKLTGFGVRESIDLWPLLRPFEVLAERYNAVFYSPQGDLFATPADAQDAKWSRYFYVALMPQLLNDDEIVRNVLRALRAIPSDDPREAAVALGQHFSEMTLPQTEPRWASEEPIDI